jgi:hypothetical protein
MEERNIGFIFFLVFWVDIEREGFKGGIVVFLPWWDGSELGNRFTPVECARMMRSAGP